MTRKKTPKAALRLIRSATAYRRLAWRRDLMGTKQAERYQARADRLMREAERIKERAAGKEGR